jgi:hypothetical protein
VVWLQFIYIYEIYHLDAMNTDLMMACVCKWHIFICLLINLLHLSMY